MELYYTNYGCTKNIKIWSPYWIINSTDLDLFFIHDSKNNNNNNENKNENNHNTSILFGNENGEIYLTGQGQGLEDSPKVPKEKKNKSNNNCNNLTYSPVPKFQIQVSNSKLRKLVDFEDSKTEKNITIEYVI
jgi:hypothetical protein